MLNKTKPVKEGQEFVFCNGNIANTIKECCNALEKLNYEEFLFHVNNDKNDIYNWIFDCIDKKIAEKIKYVKNKNELIKLLKLEI